MSWKRFPHAADVFRLTYPEKITFTRRDLFAAAALAGMLSGSKHAGLPTCVRCAREAADLMLKELEEHP